MGQMVRRDALGAFGGLDPDAAHLRLDLAVAVVTHAATGSVAHLLGAVHRAGHAGGREHALAALAAVKHQAFGAPLKRVQNGQHGFYAEQTHHRREQGRQTRKELIQAAQTASMAN
jgi:hypothetical protein